jgi:hypothetical protein
MSVFERLMDSNIMGDAWKKVIGSFRGGKLNQLVTLKPIEIYHETHEYEMDTANISVEINGFVENIIQRRLQNAFQLFNLEFLKVANTNERLSYHCHVILKAKVDYENVGNYLNFNFANKKYLLFDDRMELTFLEFKPKVVNRKVYMEIPMVASWKTKFITLTAHLIVHATGIIKYEPSKFTVAVTEIDFTYSSKNILLPFVNMIYHNDIIEALEDFLQFDIKEDLEQAMSKAQGQLDKFSEETPLISGHLEHLEMERIDLKDQLAEAIFLAEGKIQLMP